MLATQGSQLSSANFFSNDKIEIYDNQNRKALNWDSKNPLTTYFTNET